VRFVPVRRERLARIGGVAAITGGALWAIKSAGILVADYQPEYIFSVAPAFFGVACIGLTSDEGSQPGAGLVVRQALGVLAACAGVIAAASYLAQGDSEVFSVAILTAMLAVLAVLLSSGRSVAASVPFTRRRFRSRALAWLMLASIPIGGGLAAINERLLEVPLLAVSLGWICLGAALITRSEVAGPETVVRGD
jgi:hypothetical protein